MTKRIVRTTSTRTPKTKVKVKRVHGKMIVSKVNKDNNIVGVKVMSSNVVATSPVKKNNYMKRMRELVQKTLKDSGMTADEAIKQLGIKEYHYEE